MTQTARRSEVGVDSAFVEPVPKRPMLSRLSLGHLLMVVTGLLAFLLVLTVLRDQSTTTEIAVAATDIQAGTTLGESSVRRAVVADADDSILAGALDGGEIDEALTAGWVAVRTIPAGATLNAADFTTNPADGPELRAMSIPISSGHAVNGAIVAGDLVDVIVVRDGIARYVTTGAEVIAAGDSGSGVGTRSGFTITLRVDAPTSLRLAAALNGGALEIVRSTGAEPADPAAAFDPDSAPTAEE